MTKQMGLKVIDGTPTAISEYLRQRENLAESIRIRDKEIKELREEFENSIIGDKKKHLSELIKLMEDVRSKLYELGVDIEDC